jgi:hypothetical protein
MKEVLGEGEFKEFAIVEVKRVRGGPCQESGKWLIIEEIELTGSNTDVLLGSPTPVFTSEFRCDDPSG